MADHRSSPALLRLNKTAVSCARPVLCASRATAGLTSSTPRLGAAGPAFGAKGAGSRLYPRKSKQARHSTPHRPHQQHAKAGGCRLKWRQQAPQSAQEVDSQEGGACNQQVSPQNAFKGGCCGRAHHSCTACGRRRALTHGLRCLCCCSSGSTLGQSGQAPSGSNRTSPQSHSCSRALTHKAAHAVPQPRPLLHIQRSQQGRGQGVPGQCLEHEGAGQLEAAGSAVKWEGGISL